MANDEISVEFYGPMDREAAVYETFPTWQAALTFVRAWMRTGFDGFIRIFVPGSLTKNEQENELRETVGLPARY